MNDLKPNDSQKLFYTIGEVAEYTGLKSHILRYWESEFPALRPQKGPNGRRIYRPADIALVLAIKRLLYEDGYTIAGARRKLSETRRRETRTRRREVFTAVKEELHELLAMLE